MFRSARHSLLSPSCPFPPAPTANRSSFPEPCRCARSNRRHAARRLGRSRSPFCASASAVRRHDDEQGRAHAGQGVQRAGAIAVRFNYRGVGASEGSTTRATAKRICAGGARLGGTRWPGARLWLGGFSFGGAVAIRAAARAPRDPTAPDHRRAGDPPRQRFDPRPAVVPWLLVQGDQDELVDPAGHPTWVALAVAAAQLVMLPGVDHFFHGRLNELARRRRQWLADATVQRSTRALQSDAARTTEEDFR